MQRLSLAELKAQKESQVTANLEAIKGGNAGDCHCEICDKAVEALKEIERWLNPWIK